MPEVVLSYSSRLILVESPVVNILNGWRQSGTQAEAGGILIGYRRGDHLHVVNCTTPYYDDIRSRYQFLRRDSKHAKLARQQWLDSGHQAYYLGEWHTHPENMPAPSSIDNCGWEKLKNSPVGPDLIFVIVGRSGWYLQLGTASQTLEMPHTPSATTVPGLLPQ